MKKQKNLGIYNDIKNSFPEIEMNPIKSKNNIKVMNNKINIVHIKPIIKDNNNNNINNININNRKRPASGMGLLAEADTNLIILSLIILGKQIRRKQIIMEL